MRERVRERERVCVHVCVCVNVCVCVRERQIEREIEKQYDIILLGLIWSICHQKCIWWIRSLRCYRDSFSSRPSAFCPRWVLITEGEKVVSWINWINEQVNAQWLQENDSLRHTQEMQHELETLQPFLFISFFVNSNFNPSFYCLRRVKLKSRTHLSTVL